ncbi:transmembrane protein 222-like [Dermatophagoides pteronyssinus]|uniref:transmembrane protein 222-like n=1 Tax=Dermatophagoides pteronyssinus TaxID=6956 RepID=UPI003F662833
MADDNTDKMLRRETTNVNNNNKNNDNNNGTDVVNLDDYKIDHKRRYYPFTIVWTPVPILSWLFPHMGHLGIGKSDGHVRDFGRPYKILVDSLQFGRPLKYWILDPRLAKGGIKGWDDGIDEAGNLFCKRMNYLFVSNCHSHVSTALNHMEYNGRKDYNEHKLFWMFNKNCHYVSTCTFIRTWLPLTLIVSTITVIVLYTRTNVFEDLWAKIH